MTAGPCLRGPNSWSYEQETLYLNSNQTVEANIPYISDMEYSLLPTKQVIRRTGLLGGEDKIVQFLLLEKQSLLGRQGHSSQRLLSGTVGR